MKDAVILHSVDDLKHCLAEGLHDNKLLFTTHSSVEVFFKEKYNLDCHCLSKFLTRKEIINKNVDFSDNVDKILTRLDLKISPRVNKQNNLNMKFFDPLYAYIGKYHISSYMYLSLSIKKVIKKFNINKLYIYNYTFNNYLTTSTDMDYFISTLFPKNKIEVVKYRKKYNLYFLATFNKILQNWIIIFYMDKIIYYIIILIHKFKFRYFSKNRRTVLLYDELYDLDFLKKELKVYNILFYNYNSLNPIGFKYKNYDSRLSFELNNSDLNFKNNDLIYNIFRKDVLEDFSNNINDYLNSIDLLKKINNEYRIFLGIWGNAPAIKIKSMIFEFLRSKNIKIIGAQHGSLYGDSYRPWHFDSDFQRCDYFISYGFDNEDLKRLYPKKKISTEIVPLGMNKHRIEKKSKKNIDILFPITNSLSMLNGGLVRLNLDILTERQIRILEYLNGLANKVVYIKPFKYSSYENCSVLPVFDRLNNLKVVTNLNLNEFIGKYSPRIVIIEYPSQPLFDVLHLDAEIFYMADYVIPLSKNASELLKKRVHYSDDIDDIISKIDLFIKGKLDSKRDNSFYNHYVKRENTKDNALKFINDVIRQTK